MTSQQTKIADLSLQIEYAKRQFAEITSLTHQSNCGILQLLELVEDQKNTIDSLIDQVQHLKRLNNQYEILFTKTFSH